ncbi:hypothetical protein B0J12DRAFT_453710 [Macrophomina phaseolina]|uniref:Secreted protein n=1 Tax=Macrophomina phaseolina TaxID=35725 RepID=A0ABQ8GGC8_9PEZI|nr:hypothetical protein B0J12DRAFT_453710 [Macrophomina phaseolina]
MAASCAGLLRLRAAAATAAATALAGGGMAGGESTHTGEERAAALSSLSEAGEEEERGAAEKRWRGEEGVGSVRRRSNGRCSACSCGQARVRKLGSESMPCGAVAVLGGLCRWVSGGAGGAVPVGREKCRWRGPRAVLS